MRASQAMHEAPRERHRIHRAAWLRAAVLGANDGIVSVASLILGVAAAQAARGDILLAGAAGLVAGALSMAAGEYVSVSSQGDMERADLERERRELAAAPELERRELASIYVRRGVPPALAHEVAGRLMAHDALGAHARDELGISSVLRARPLHAAAASALAFALGGVLPLAVAVLAPGGALLPAIALASLVSLALLGSLAASIGGAPLPMAAWRVTFWGALAMGLTAGFGALVGQGV